MDFLLLKNVRINIPSISIVKDMGFYSVLILFNKVDVIRGDEVNCVNNLIEFSKEVAEMLKAESYCAGLEPAEDEATRIFTGDVPGPYTL